MVTRAQKDLFRELTKLAVGGYGMGARGYSPYGMRGGGGGVPSVYQSGRHGSFAGPHPAFVPGMLAAQQQDVPNQGVGPAFGRYMHQREMERDPVSNQLVGAGGKETADYAMMNDAKSERDKHQVLMQQAEDQKHQLGRNVNDAAAAAREAQDKMNASPMGRMAYNATQGGITGGLSRIGTFLTGGLGSGTHDEFVRAAAQHAKAQGNFNNEQSSLANQSKMHQANVERYQKQLPMLEQRNLDATGSARDLMMKGEEARQTQKLNRNAAGPASMGAPTANPAPSVGSQASGRANVATANPQGTMPLSHQPVVPQQPQGAPVQPTPPPTKKMPPLGSSPGSMPIGAPPKMSRSLMPLLSIDRLVEGAAQSMVERYIKIAAAELDSALGGHTLAQNLIAKIRARKASGPVAAPAAPPAATRSVAPPPAVTPGTTGLSSAKYLGKTNFGGNALAAAEGLKDTGFKFLPGKQAAARALGL